MWQGHPIPGVMMSRHVPVRGPSEARGSKRPAARRRCPSSRRRASPPRCDCLLRGRYGSAPLPAVRQPRPTPRLRPSRPQQPVYIPLEFKAPRGLNVKHDSPPSGHHTWPCPGECGSGARLAGHLALGTGSRTLCGLRVVARDRGGDAPAACENAGDRHPGLCRCARAGHGRSAYRAAPAGPGPGSSFRRDSGSGGQRRRGHPLPAAAIPRSGDTRSRKTASAMAGAAW